MRFAFVDAEKAKFSVALLCRTLQVSRTGYYAWVSRAPSQGDVTAVATDEGWLYVVPMIDLFNREVIGLACGNKNDQDLTLKALDAAIAMHGASEGLIHHSDRGSTYTATSYRESLEKHGIVCSMSRKGDCWDNGVAESFFATLKKELIYRRHFATRAEAALAIFEYVEVFYNRFRLHSSNDYCSPVDYRMNNAMVA